MSPAPSRADTAFAKARAGPSGATPFAIATFGLRLGVEISAPELVDEALRRLPPGWERTDWRDLDRTVRLSRAGDAHCYRVTIDDEPPSGPMARETALDAFENAFQYHVAEFATPWLFVHAGVVGWKGRAIVIPGRSHSGKTTMSRALVEAGGTYLSDEYAVLDAEGRVHPYPRPLSQREGPFGPAGRIDLSSRTLPPGASLPIGLVAALQFDAGADWDVEDITRAQGIMAMCDNTVAIQRRPQDTLDYLGRALAGARAITGSRGEAVASAGQLLRELTAWT